MAGGGSGPGGLPGILIQLGINTKQFFVDLNQALTQSLGLTTNWTKQVQQNLKNTFSAQQIKDFSIEVDKFTSRLQVNQKQFAYLIENIDNYKAAAQFAAQGGGPLLASIDQISNASIAFGVKFREAGLILVSTGEMEINTLNKVLLNLGQNVTSVNELNRALANGSANVNNMSEQLAFMQGAGNQAAQGTDNLGNATKKTAGAFEFLENRIKSVVVSLLIVQTIYKIVQAFKDLTAASQELAQTQYELSANVEYANKAIGPQIGNLKQWQAQIESLSNSLRVFSKQDITEAVSKTIELTGQLGFTKDQMSSLIEVAAHLAERTGKSLIDTVTELGNAIGGGRLQGLHDLGLYIRTVDLQTESWTEGLGKNVNGLSDQQRALIALNVILNKTNDLVQTTGDYLGSTAGQMKAADVAAENSKNNISKSLEGLNLALKSIWADFLGYVSDALSKFTLLQQFIDKFNTDHAQKQAAGGTPQVKDFGVTSKFGADPFLSGQEPLQELLDQGKFNDFFKQAPKYIDVTTDAYVRLSKAVKDYADALANVKAVQAEQNTGFGKRGQQTPQSVLSSEAGTGGSNLSDNEINAVDAANKKIQDLLDQAGKDLIKAGLQYADAATKAYDDKIKANLDALKKYDDNLAKINLDFKYKVIDETTKYNRELADLATEEGQKESDAADERNKKIIDNKKKYYDALRLLDEQFYFDIFDAVANNDAIAVLAAERKYNLDKDKLNQNYKDQNDAADQNYKDNIEQIRKDTERRRQLLKERYDQQNADYAIQLQREKDANEKAFKDQLAENKDNYDNQMTALKAKWDEEKALIRQNTEDAYNKLLTDLAADLKAHTDYFTDLKKQWDDYYKHLTDLQTDNQGITGVPPLPGSVPPPPPTNECPTGMRWCAATNSCLTNDTPCPSGALPSSTGTSVTSDTGSGTTKQVKITIGSDGTVSEAIIQQVIKEVADTVQQMAVERGV